jgi:hypothetical protein
LVTEIPGVAIGAEAPARTLRTVVAQTVRPAIGAGATGGPEKALVTDAAFVAANPAGLELAARRATIALPSVSVVASLVGLLESVATDGRDVFAHTVDRHVGGLGTVDGHVSGLDGSVSARSVVQQALVHRFTSQPQQRRHGDAHAAPHGPRTHGRDHR